MGNEFLYVIYLTGLCKESVGIELGGGNKKVVYWHVLEIVS
jgi:hypothetical protein